MTTSKIKESYEKNKESIESQLRKFESLRNSSDERMFQELAFVIFTSQSDARNSWKAVRRLEKDQLLFKGSAEDISKILNNFEIQYEDRKAQYLIKNRKMLSQPTFSDPSNDLKIKNKIKEENLEKTRKWFKENIKGISWKGSSHFLRNIGYGDEFAIISKHILKKMYELELVEDVSPPKNEEQYMKYELIFRRLAKELDLSVHELDLTLWSMETGEVFK